MVKQELCKPGEIVKKDNRLIRTRVSVQGVDASRILAQLISCIHTDDPKFNDSYAVAVKDFLTVPGGSQYTRIKGVCEELAKAIAELEEPDAKGGYRYKACPFFTEIEYQNGVISAHFNTRISDLLLALKKCFTTYALPEYLELPSVYSQRLFEILQSWRDKPEVTLQLKDLHRMLDTPPSLRSNFKDFRKRVLEKAHKDISTKTSLSYEWDAIKKGRAVNAIRFIFAKKRALPMAEKKIEKDKALSAKNRTRKFIAFTSCLAERGAACEGGHQPENICELCRKFR